MHMSDPHEDLLSWLRGRVAKYVGQAPADIRCDRELAHLGLDSVGIVELSVDLEEYSGVDINPESLVEQPSLAAVAQMVIKRARNGG